MNQKSEYDQMMGYRITAITFDFDSKNASSTLATLIL